MVADRRKHIKYLEKKKPASLKKISKTLGIQCINKTLANESILLS